MSHCYTQVGHIHTKCKTDVLALPSGKVHAVGSSLSLESVWHMVLLTLPIIILQGYLLMVSLYVQVIGMHTEHSFMYKSASQWLRQGCSTLWNNQKQKPNITNSPCHA